MRDALISIIMPAYNAEKYIKEAIDSIIEQTYTNWELIIADDGSIDKTKEIIESFNDSRIIISHNDINLGYLKTCNRLFSLCQGEYITFQDADDISYPNRLEEQLNAFDTDDLLGMVGTLADTISSNGKILDIVKRPTSYNEIKKNIIKVNTFIGATVMIKKEILKDIGGYREFFDRLAYQDYDWTSLISERYKSINLYKSLYQYRQYSSSTSKIIDPKRAISNKLVQFLAKQREENNGLDCLMTKDEYIINNYMENLLVPYKKEPSLIYREFVSSAMYNKMYKRAIFLSMEAIKKEPLKVINWRTLLYCIRKIIL